jgi:hypothetical protein
VPSCRETPPGRLPAALRAALDQIVLAAAVITDTVIDLVGAIGEHVPAELLPDRRVPRPTKSRRAVSIYIAGGPNIDRTTQEMGTVGIACRR